MLKFVMGYFQEFAFTYYSQTIKFHMPKLVILYAILRSTLYPALSITKDDKSTLCNSC
jgi:hypothetical protein